MMYQLPEKFETARGHLKYNTTDTGDRYLVFLVEPEDSKLAEDGTIAGLVIPARVRQSHLDQVLGEIHDSGGIRFIVIPRRDSESV